MDRALLLYLVKRLPRMSRTVVLVDDVDADGAAIFRPAVLPDGDRAQARRELALGELRKHPDGWLLYLVDVADLPAHIVILMARSEGGKMEVREVFQHAESAEGRDVRDAVMRFAASQQESRVQ